MCEEGHHEGQQTREEGPHGGLSAQTGSARKLGAMGNGCCTNTHNVRVRIHMDRNNAHSTQQPNGGRNAFYVFKWFWYQYLRIAWMATHNFSHLFLFIMYIVPWMQQTTYTTINGTNCLDLVYETVLHVLWMLTHLPNGGEDFKMLFYSRRKDGDDQTVVGSLGAAGWWPPHCTRLMIVHQRAAGPRSAD